MEKLVFSKWAYYKLSQIESTDFATNDERFIRNGNYLIFDKTQINQIERDYPHLNSKANSFSNFSGKFTKEVIDKMNTMSAKTLKEFSFTVDNEN